MADGSSHNGWTSRGILKAKKMAQMNLVSTKVLDIKASFECVIFLTCVRLIQELKKTRFTSL